MRVWDASAVRTLNFTGFAPKGGVSAYARPTSPATTMTSSAMSNGLARCDW